MESKFKNIPVILCFIFVLSAFMLFFHLGSTCLVNWDEAWFASVAQDITQRNDWMEGKFNGQIWFYEPPLLTWILASIYKIFGPSEFWLRSFNALSGLLVVFVIFWLALRLIKSKPAAIIAVIILLSDIEFLFRSRQINVEIPLTLFLVASLAALHFYPPKINLSLFFLGLAFLTKRASPLLALPAILILSRPRSLVKGIIVFILVALPWFFYGYFRWRQLFINEFFLGYTLGKITTANRTVGTSVLFYFSGLRHAFKIWFLLVPPALAWFIYKKQKLFQPLLVYIFTFLTILTLLPIKSSWYLLPVHPIIAILVAAFLNQVFPLKSVKLLVIAASFIFIFQVIKHRTDYFVPDTTRHQAQIASFAKTLTAPEDIIYLDDDYLPVAVFYSQRKIIPLRFDRLSRQAFPLLDLKSKSYFLSNTLTADHLRSGLPSIHFNEVCRVSDLILFQATAIK